MGKRRRLSAVETAYKATRGRFLERFATARQTRIGHEVFVSVEGLLTLGGFYAIRRPVGQQFPALLVGLDIRYHALVETLLVHGGIENRAQHFDAAIEIARHHVGGRNVDRGLRVREAVASAEAVDAAMLEEAADDHFYPGIVGQ